MCAEGGQLVHQPDLAAFATLIYTINARRTVGPSAACARRTVGPSAACARRTVGPSAASTSTRRTVGPSAVVARRTVGPSAAYTSKFTRFIPTTFNKAVGW